MSDTVQRAGKRINYLLRLPILFVLVFPIAVGYFCYSLSQDAWLAVSNAKSIQGVVTEMASESYSYRRDNREVTGYRYTLYVAFTSDEGEELVRPVQHSGPDDIVFGEDDLGSADYSEGATLDLLYHPELGDKVWLDEFWVLWLVPFILVIVTLVSAFLSCGAIFLFLKP